MSLEIEKLRKLAQQKADSQEYKNTSAWQNLYYGFIFGWQASESYYEKKPICNTVEHRMMKSGIYKECPDCGKKFREIKTQ